MKALSIVFTTIYIITIIPVAFAIITVMNGLFNLYYINERRSYNNGR